MRTITNLVGGESASAADGRTAEIFNPATATAFAQAPVSGAADVDAAMQAAAGRLPGLARHHAEPAAARDAQVR